MSCHVTESAAQVSKVLHVLNCFGVVGEDLLLYQPILVTRPRVVV